MNQHIAYIALVVDDYDDAIEFYTKKLNFNLVEDTVLNETKRWVLVAPKAYKECCLLLAKAATEEQKSRIGNQTGGRIFLFLYTDNFQTDFLLMEEKELCLLENRLKKLMVQLQCLKTCMVIFGT